MRKYEDLDSISRANYWNLMLIAENLHELCNGSHRETAITKEAEKSIYQLAVNLKLELYSHLEDERNQFIFNWKERD